MALYPLKELIKYARKNSEFYRTLYAQENKSADVTLEELPIIDQAKFWAANSFEHNTLLTATPRDGIVFKSGGTTGSPKFSLYTREEWHVFTKTFGRALSSGGLAGAERVANLFYAGELYASFLFIHESLENASDPTLNFPISGATSPEHVVDMVKELSIDTLAGVPTTLLSIADYLIRSERRLPTVKRVLFGGESMYSDQRRVLEHAIPGVKIASIGYASVDAGLLGYADEGCGPDEHRGFDETILELIDEETGQPIQETGRAGKIVITSLTRLLMPIIRYPAGDRAEWVEPFSPTNRNRKFRLVGRSEEGARVGPVSIYFDDIQQILSPFSARLGLSAFQLVVHHEEGRDRLTVKLGVAEPSRIDDKILSEIHSALLETRPMLAELATEGKVHEVNWEPIQSARLSVNARTGKLRRVLDLRGQGG